MATKPTFSTLDMNLSDTCNLRCPWCYACGGKGKPYSATHVADTFNWFFNQADPRNKKGLRVNLYGGEPLIEFNHIQELIPQYNQKIPIPIKWSVVTNCTLLDAAKVDWLLANKVTIACSVDGIPAVQDVGRVYADGAGSSAIVAKNVLHLNSCKPSSARMTVTPESAAHVAESIRYLCEDLHFIGASAVPAAGVNWTPEALAVLKGQITEVTDWWLDNMRKGKHYGLYHLKRVFRRIWQPGRPQYACGAGRGMVGVDTLGNIWPCHRFCGSTDTQYRLGTVYDGITNMDWYRRIQAFDLRKMQHKGCATCPSRDACTTICLHETIAHGAGPWVPLSQHCNLWPFYWADGQRAHKAMMDENNQQYLRRYDPARQATKAKPVKVSEGIHDYSI